MKSLLKKLGILTIGIVLVVFISNTVRDLAIPEAYYKDIHWEGAPFVPEYDHSKWNVLFDQHSHTLHSDGVLSPEDNIRWHIAMGFNAMVISDHNTFSAIDEAMSVAKEKYADEIIVIPGVEWTSNRVHMNFLFPPHVSGKVLSSKLKMPSNFPSDQQIQDAIKAAHDLGGIVSVNHIPWTNRTYPDNGLTREDFLAWGIDYIEVINDKEWDHESYDLCRTSEMDMISGTDMHSPGTVYGWTLMNVDTMSPEAIFDELIAGNTELIYMPQGAPYPHEHKMTENMTHTLLKPLIVIGDYFTELTFPLIKWKGLFILLGWIYLVFFLTEALKWGSRKLRKSRQKDQ